MRVLRVWGFLALVSTAAALLATPNAVAATFTVTETDDSNGACKPWNCSLREAITAANAAAGPDFIHFAISCGPQKIKPYSPLPALTGPTVVDATTQPGFLPDKKPIVELEGKYAGAAASGLTVGSATTIRGFVINKFARNGISVVPGATGVAIEGNYLGTDRTGTADLGNGLAGVSAGAAAVVTIGGTATGQRNVISGNQTGIFLDDAGGAVVQGNYVGTKASGTASLGNSGAGIAVDETPGVTVGGILAEAGNVVSGNGSHGISVIGLASAATIQGNRIGTNAAGTADLGNSGKGVSVLESSGSVIGGSSSAARNVISGNNGGGVAIAGDGAADNLVQGNYVGTAVDGASALGNSGPGVLVQGPSNTISGNVVAANAGGGVGISTLQASGNVVKGNTIGTNAAGTAARPNGGPGVSITGAFDNQIGGAGESDANLISGHGSHPGVRIAGAMATGNRVSGNRIGTSADGGSGLPNADGVVIEEGASGNTIGAGNLISGNARNGVRVAGSASGNTIAGNRIGTNPAGTAARPNGREGVRLESGGNTVGGTDTGAHNLISGNTGFGVLVYGSSGNAVQGNYVGTDAGGAQAVPNGWDGIGIDGGSANQIGGSAPGAGNLVSGNTSQGIAVFGVDFPSTSGNSVQGNLVGTTADGTSPLGNGGEGIRLLNAVGTLVGGAGPNVIAASGGAGLTLGGASSSNMIRNNFVGTNADGAAGLGNALQGVKLSGGATGNVVGGATAADGNVVASNGGAGIVGLDPTVENQLRRNRIFSNGGLGIDLGAPLVSPNDVDDVDAGTNRGQNFPVLAGAQTTPLAGGTTTVEGELETAPSEGAYHLDFFVNESCDPSGNGEAERYLGSLTISDDGGTAGPGGVAFTFDHGAELQIGHVVTATATDSAGNTSELSACKGVTTAFNATIALDSDLTAAIAGAQRVPIEDIPATALTQPDPNTEATPLDAIPLDAIDLGASPLDAIPLDAIGLTAPLLQEALGGVHLSDLPLSTPGGWEALLADTALANVPLNTVTLADVYADATAKSHLAAVPLDAIDVSATPLDAIPLGALALGATPLDAIPLDAIGTNDAAENAADWCAAINAIEGYGCPPLDPSSETLIGLVIRGVPLDAIPLDAIPLDAIPLDAIPLDAIPLDAIPLDAIDLAGSPLDAIPLDAIDFAVSPLDAIPLDAIPLDAIGDLVDCSGGFCGPGVTLGDAATASRLVPGATLGELVAVLEPGSGATVADLIYGLPSTVVVDGRTIRLTLRDLFALLLGSTDYDWSGLDLGEFPLADFAAEGGVVTYEATFTVTGGGVPSATALVHATLPEGGRYVRGSTQLLKAGVPQPIDEPRVLAASLEWEADADIGDEYVLRWRARPGLELGTSEVNANIILPGMPAAQFAAPVPLQVLQTLEENDTAATAKQLAGGSLYVTHLPRADTDFLKIPVPPAGSRVVVTMTHLGADFDLLAFGPDAPPLRSLPLDAIPTGNPPIVDVEANLDSRNESLPPEVLQDLPLDAISTQTLRAVSDNRGTADERIEILSQGEGGFYTLLLAPYEDADSSAPFLLESEIVGPAALGPCAPRTPGSFPFAGQGSPGTLPNLAALPAGLNTVFLVNAERAGDTFGAAQATTMLARLNTLAGRGDLGVVGAVIPVEGSPAVAAAYDAWDANPCAPELANAAVTAIGELLDDVIDPPGATPARPVANVVLVGGDDLLPMGRVPDETEIANERSYASTFAGPANQYLGGLANGLLMTDDVYGERAIQSFLGRQLFVPELNVGRLVESGPEITAQLQQFMDSGGVMTPSTSLVTGYDFLSDGAQAINAPFASDFGTAAQTLISETWNRDALLGALFPATGPEPDINSINAHFDHRRGLPADQNLLQREDELFTSESFRNDFGAGALSERLILSIGCHAGYPVSDAVLGSASPLAVDWAQTFALRGAFGSVLNTGYGLGDTVEVGYSELLHSLISRGLDGTLTIGEAIRFAKHEYVSTRPALGLYDQKVSVETTLYGLPMYEVGTGGTPPSTPPPLPTVTDSATGLTAAPFAVTPAFEEVVTPDGTILRADAGTWATNRRPIQPLFDLDATQPGQVAHGALLTALNSTDANVDAVFSRAVFDDSEDEPEVVGEGSHPARLQAITSFESPAGRRQRLLLTVGQFRTDGVSDPEGVGIQRRYTNLHGRIFYAPPGEQDFRPPRLGPVRTFEVGSSIGFALDVADLEETGGPGTVGRVVALYRDCSSVWKFAELAKDPESNRWSGGGPVDCDTIDYFVQAVDGAGNVAVTHKKALLETISVPETVGTVTGLCNEATCAGWSTGDVSVTLASASPGVEIEFSVDGGPFQPYTAPFLVTGDGVHDVDFRGSDGSHGTVVPAIDTTDPTVEMTTPAPEAAYALGSSVLADYTCADAGSGAQSCEGTIASGQPLDTSTVGTKSISVTATDAVGHTFTLTRTYEVVQRAIVFASTRTGLGDLYSIGPTGGTPTQLTSGPAIDAEPAWSPDSKRIVFTRVTFGNIDLHVLELATGEITRLTTHSAIDTSPAFSPDGTQIAFASNRGPGGNWDVYVVGSAGGAVTRLTTHSSADLLPAWSSDGTQLAFTSKRTGNGDLYRLDLSAPSTTQTRLTSGSSASGLDTEPAWSGTRIAFSTNRHGSSNFELYVLDTTTLAQTRLTDQPGLQITPAWSRDGKQLAFMSSSTGNGDIYVATVPTPPAIIPLAAQTRVTTHSAIDAFADW